MPSISFPLTHNLDDSPYLPRSSSPFEQELVAAPFPETPSSDPPCAPPLSLPSKSLSVTTSSSSCSYIPSSCSSSSTPCTLSCSTTLSVLSSPPACTSPPLSSTTSSTPLPSTVLPLNPSVASSSSPSSPPARRSNISFSTSPPRKGDNDYIKRPENAFILFRQSRCGGNASVAASAKNGGVMKKGKRQAELSKTISEQWKALSKAEKAYWEQKAKDRKKEHAKMYPDYIYRPQRGSKGEAIGKKPRKNARNELDFQIDEGSGMNTVTFVVSTPTNKQIGSATASLPTMIQVPDVYKSPSSCPASPSLLDMLHRRTAHPGRLEEGFDYHVDAPSVDYHVDSPSFMESPVFKESQGLVASSAFCLRTSDQFLYAESRPGSDQIMPILSHQIVSPPSFSEPSSPDDGPGTPPDVFYQLEPEVYVHPSSSNEYAWCNDRIPPSEYGIAWNEHSPPSSDYTSPHYTSVVFESSFGCCEPLSTEYTAGYGWHSGDIWGGTDLALSAEDFDLNAIPLLQLGEPSEYTDYSQFSFDSSMQS